MMNQKSKNFLSENFDYLNFALLKKSNHLRFSKKKQIEILVDKLTEILASSDSNFFEKKLNYLSRLMVAECDICWAASSLRASLSVVQLLRNMCTRYRIRLLILIFIRRVFSLPMRFPAENDIGQW